ncbi:hypothetical protein LVY65_05265 [Sphingomonas sp. G124]|uniref:DUF2306 domain-containing protein n=1 Tax=Sphingomonas cremea TaxID=2904799 RepID=A0A9X1QJY0_9SPHN|nr:hypothetical protein [Sphingomonas cremea]MCF2514475.1 hypothetical protein [Sphingomonas cremea]
MATIEAPRRRPMVGKFYVTMAAIFVAIAFGGFFETYWLQIAQGTFTGSPMMHLHGLLFSLWTVFFLSQALLVANGKIKKHRAWGLLGISLATAMLFTGLAVTIEGLQARLDLGYGDGARAFTIVPVTAVLLFAGFVAAAVVNLKRPEWHKRQMLLATTALLQAAVARFFFLAATGGGPGLRPGLAPPLPIERTMVPVSLVVLLIVAAMVHDWRSQGRVHPAYWWGFGVTIAVQVLRLVVGYSDAWYRFTDFLLAF